MGTLEGKTAVVTGAPTGIGYATAARLAAEGAHVFITGRREAELRSAAATLGPAVTAVPGDIAEPSDLDRLYALVAARGRGLDVLFANAATASFAPLELAGEDEFDDIFRINVRGTWLTVRKALPLLNEGASVIFNASTRAADGWENYGLYSASKAAMRSLARTFANELKGRGIRVNTVSPGTIDTPAVNRILGDEKAAAAKATMAEGIPLGRAGRPEEVAGVVAFLASADSTFMLGSNIDIDGGENQF